MISLKKQNKGFTIVELLIVIVIIGILAGLVFVAYSGITKRARNTDRTNDIATIQKQVEVFYQDNGHYPSLTNLNDASWRAENMKGLADDGIKDPQADCDATSDTGACLLATATAADKKYSYAVEDADGESCEDDSENCAQYTLTGYYEGDVNGNATTVKSNLD